MSPFVLIVALFIKIVSIILSNGNNNLALLASKKIINFGPNAIQLIQSSGYPLEIHGNLVTADGYILEMHRIPYSPKNNTHKGRIPILLLHGVMTSSADFVLTGPERGIAYLLADRGYDVWMGNVRGNAFSRKHKIYNAERDGKDFWNFSFHEIGYYDLPVMIDHVLQTTGQDKLHCIGHSQGTTSFVVLLSEKPEYNKKIRMLNLLAPVIYLKHIGNIAAQILSPHAEELEATVVDKFHVYEFIQKSYLIEVLAKLFCFKHSPINVCPLILSLVAGFDPSQSDKDLSTVIFSNIPLGSSTKQLLHFAQLIKSGYFRQYDYFSPEKNLIHYGQTSPLDYNITNVVAPIGLHYAQNDLLSSPTDVRRLIKELPNVVIDNLVDYNKFNHYDFVWALDVQTILYDELFVNMAHY